MDDYPRQLSDLERRFATEEACRKYLADLRWPSGFICPRCGGTEAWFNRGLLFFRLLQNAMVIAPTTYRQMVKSVRRRKPSNHKM